jgi:hypothetical protein
MNDAYTLEVTPQYLGLLATQVANRLEDIRPGIEAAMAERFFEIVRSNFGDFGVDRPIEWAPLTSRYAKKVGRDNATLFITGKLESAVHMETGPDGGRVFISSDEAPSALAHQYGYAPNGIPPRPYFPITESGGITWFTQMQVEEAARVELARLIGGEYA